MPKYSPLARRMFAGLLVSAMLVLALSAQAHGQQEPPPEWKRALELYEAQNFVDALPLLEKVAASRTRQSRGSFPSRVRPLRGCSN